MRHKLKQTDDYHDSIGSVNVQKKLHGIFNFMNKFEIAVYSNLKLSKRLKPILCDPADLAKVKFHDFHGFEVPKIQKPTRRLMYHKSNSRMKRKLLENRNENIVSNYFDLSGGKKLNEYSARTRHPSCHNDTEREAVKNTGLEINNQSVILKPRRKALSSMTNLNKVDIRESVYSILRSSKLDQSYSSSPNPVDLENVEVAIRTPIPIFSNKKINFLDSSALDLCEDTTEPSIVLDPKYSCTLASAPKLRKKKQKLTL